MIAIQVLGTVGEVDSEAADHERRPDDDRVADLLRHGERLLERRRLAARRLRDAEPLDEAGEAHPLLGLVDGLEIEAAQGDACLGERRRQAERRLAAELDERVGLVAVERPRRGRPR